MTDKDKDKILTRMELLKKENDEDNAKLINLNQIRETVIQGDIGQEWKNSGAWGSFKGYGKYLMGLECLKEYCTISE